MIRRSKLILKTFIRTLFPTVNTAILPFKILMALLCFEREIWIADIKPVVGS